MRKQSSLSRLTWLTIMIITVSTLVFWARRLSQKTVITIPETLIVGTTADYPPFSFKEDNKLIGFDIDVATEIGKRLGKKIEFKDTPFELLIPQLQQGYLHFAAAGLSPNAERARSVTFTSSYLVNDPLVVLSLADSAPIANLNGIKNKTVAVNQGYNADFFMSNIKEITILHVPTITDAIRALEARRADVFVTALNTLTPIFNQFGKEHFSFFMVEETDENIAIAMSPRYPQLEQEIGFIINRMINDGTMEELKQKWHVQ